MRIFLYSLIFILIGVNFYLYIIDRDVDESEEYRLLIIDDREEPAVIAKDGFQLIDSVFMAKGFDKKWIYTKKTDSVWFKYIKVPQKYTLARYNLFFQRTMTENGIKIRQAEEFELSNKLVFSFNANDSTAAIVELRLTPKLEDNVNLSGNISVVYDALGEQWGQQWVKNLLESELPSAVSIMPDKWASKTIYEEALKNNKTVLISIPMEPLTGNIDKEKLKILSGMNDFTIDYVLEKAHSAFPKAAGVSNYRGDKVISDYRTMDIFLRRLKMRSLFYIENPQQADSYSQIISSDRSLSYGYVSEYFDVPGEFADKFRRIFDSVLNGEDAILMFTATEESYNFVTAEILPKSAEIGIISLEEILRLKK
jgi:polysaccharide deacetylase 2 family uncharacterized protein YibQ